MPLEFLSNSPHQLGNLSSARAEHVLSATVFAAFPIQALFDQMLVAESFPRVIRKDISSGTYEQSSH